MNKLSTAINKFICLNSIILAVETMAQNNEKVH